MPSWRAKDVGYAEAGAFQNDFEKLYLQMGAPKHVALFSRGMAEVTLLISPGSGELWERLSPGGWSDLQEAPGQQWILLVGHAGAAEELGL